MTVSVFDYDAALTACANGQQSALLALYHHEAPAMRALALAMLNDADLADIILQETFILAWRNAAGFSPAMGPGRAWLYSILRYRAQARVRQQSSQSTPDMAVLPNLSFPSEPDPQSGTSVLSSLPAPQLDALLQAYLHGGNAADIAARLDRTEPDIQASVDSVLNHLDETFTV